MRFATVMMMLAALAAGPAAGASAFEKAPDVELSDAAGGRTRIDYRSARVTLVNFWATWCVPCREEMPVIARLSSRFGSRGFQAVGIAAESGGVAEIRSFLEKNPDLGVKYRILVADDDTLERFGDVGIVPTTYLFDSDGKLLKTWLGVTTGFEAKLEAEVQKRLGLPSAQFVK